MRQPSKTGFPRPRQSGVHVCLVIASLLLGVGCGAQDNPSSRSSVATYRSLQDFLAELNQQASQLEESRDVKCWTSFKRLETFIAGCQLSPESTHLKTEVVQNYFDQIWAEADRSTTKDSIIDAAPFTRTVRRFVPWETDSVLEYRVTFPDREIVVKFQDVENFRSTVEPIRLLQSLTTKLHDNKEQRKVFSPTAIHSATEFIALLSTIVLRESYAVAVEHQHHQIEATDMLQTDQRLAKELGLQPLASDKNPTTRRKDSREDIGRGNQVHKIIQQKIQALETFNSHYSREHLDRVFVADLATHERQWAKRAIRPDAAAKYKESDLVDLAEFLYEACARQHPQSDPLTGPQMLATIQSFYPSVTHFEHGTIHLFPNGETIQGLKVEEYEADAFRDTAWHWRALQLALERAIDRPLPTMDLYALEELSEFLSVFGVAYVKLTGQIVREHSTADIVAIDRTAFKSARRAFVLASQKHTSAIQNEPGVAPPTPIDDGGIPSNRIAEDRAAVRADLAKTFIENCFTDVTAAAGVDFQHQSSESVLEHRFAIDGKRPQDIHSYVTRAQHLRAKGYRSQIPNHSLGIEGGGVAVGDADGDGLMDIYLVSGTDDQLYRNVGELRFEKAAIQIRAELESDPHNARQIDAEGRGAYFVDYDNDGDQDLFVTQVYAPNRLLRNDGEFQFTDVTHSAGMPLRTDLISHSAVWFDFDNDGFLDIYIGNYGDWLGDQLPLVQADSRNGQPNLLLRNDGQGRFVDISAIAAADDNGWAQAVSHFDANGDGWQDLYIANDFGQDILLLNERGERFHSQVVGQGHFLHGMSVGFTDVNHDGAEDIYVSNISMFSFASKHIQPDQSTTIAVSQRTTQDMRMLENNMFLVNGSDGFHEKHQAYFDRSVKGSGWAWDADFFDFDNDGHEDLYIANGREPNLSYAFERNVLYKQHGERFYDVSAISGADIRSNSRGVVHADLDKDGDLDLVINNYKSGAVVLRNNLQRNNWIRFRLQGVDSNRNAIGAKVTVHTPGSKQQRVVRGGSGFLSKGDGDLHFGLGQAKVVDKVEITWPSQKVQVLEHVSINRGHTIVEP